MSFPDKQPGLLVSGVFSTYGKILDETGKPINDHLRFYFELDYQLAKVNSSDLKEFIIQKFANYLDKDMEEIERYLKINKFDMYRR